MISYCTKIYLSWGLEETKQKLPKKGEYKVTELYDWKQYFVLLYLKVFLSIIYVYPTLSNQQ